ncbi:MAG: hypothetical protein R3B96_21490 [Pirellulaceae bacterium]
MNQLPPHIESKPAIKQQRGCAARFIIGNQHLTRTRQVHDPSRGPNRQLRLWERRGQLAPHSGSGLRCYENDFDRAVGPWRIDGEMPNESPIGIVGDSRALIAGRGPNRTRVAIDRTGVGFL